MRSLRAHRSSFQRRITRAVSLVLCFDYDGTVSPITDHPSRARLPASTKRLLKRLIGLPRLWVALVSGRALHDLKRMVGIRDLYYVGNHGFELEGPNLRYVNPIARATRPLLRRIAGELKAALQPIPGAWVEEKGLTLSIHWRNVPESARRRFRRLVAQSLAPHLKQRSIRVTEGKRVIEIRPPVPWDKGEVILWLCSRLRGCCEGREPLVVYFGDDRTDEDAFRAVNRLRGISVLVGRPTRRSAARYWLKDPREVHTWLVELSRVRRGRG